MARIKRADTGPEVALRRALRQAGLRCRVRMPRSRIHPDVVFSKERVVVFVDGCFWHGCPDHYVAPRTSRPFWERKLWENVERDRRQTAALEADGWRVLRFWEHEVFTGVERVVARIKAAFSERSRRRRNAPRVCHVEFIDDAGIRERRHLVDLRDRDWEGFIVRKRSTKKW